MKAFVYRMRILSRQARRQNGTSFMVACSLLLSFVCFILYVDCFNLSHNIWFGEHTRNLLFHPIDFWSEEENIDLDRGQLNIPGSHITCLNADLGRPHTVFNDKADKLLPRIIERMHEAGLPGFLWQGTLLGWYRNCDVLPWEHDIDIAIMAPDFDRKKLDWVFEPYEIVEPRVRFVGAGIEVHGSTPSARAKGEKHGYVQIRYIVLDEEFAEFPFDFWVVHRATTYDGTHFLFTSGFSHYWWRWMAPMDVSCTGTLTGVEINVPCNVEQILLKQHGTSWATPVDNTGKNRAARFRNFYDYPLWMTGYRDSTNS